jgi:hypothetical protein
MRWENSVIFDDGRAAALVDGDDEWHGPFDGARRGALLAAIYERRPAGRSGTQRTKSLAGT